jgi:hypothetical protein
MGKSVMKAKGLNGEVELMDDRVVITRPGVINMFFYGLHSMREIPLMAISEVSFRPAKFGTGRIEFVRSGRSMQEKKQVDTVVKFAPKQSMQFEKLKEKTFELMNQLARQKQ